MRALLASRFRRQGRAVSTWILVGLAALSTAPATRQLADAQPAYQNYPFEGCFKDTKNRVLPYQENVRPLTLENCAAACLANKEDCIYAGLEFGQECFCGKELPETNATNCDMVSNGNDNSNAGGRWAISVYNLGTTDAETNEGTGNTGDVVAVGSSADLNPVGEGAGAGGGNSTDVSKEKSPVVTGKRAFTVVNNCQQTVRVGSTGGRITFGVGTDGSNEQLCNDWGDSAVYNPGPLGIGCYWDLPDEETGNTDRMLESGKHFRYYLHETLSETRWSGTIWGSTDCDLVDGCATGVCVSPSTNHICPAYVGPGGPTTKAEFTLSDVGNDYYDISAIDGVNLPMMIEPDNPIYEFDESKANILMYMCGSPGSPDSPTGLGDCSWKYSDVVSSVSANSLSQYLRLVLPDNYASPVLCSDDSECNGQTCGVHPQRWADGSYKGGVEQGSCGKHVAWISAGGACAGGWATGVFPDAFPFYCGESVRDGMRANMYGCHGGALAHSGYTPGADSTACGCPDWILDDVYAPSISECNGVNEEWVAKAQPWARQLKEACPTAYTFPYDDQTSTFMCMDWDGNEQTEDIVNTQSYTITFCPGDSEASMFG